VSCHTLFNGALPVQVDPNLLFFHYPRCQVEFPKCEKWIVIAVQKCAPNVFAKNTTVLVLDQKVLAKARAELVLPGVGPHTYNTFCPMGDLTVFEKDVNAIQRNPVVIEWEPEHWQRIRPFMQQLT